MRFVSTLTLTLVSLVGALFVPLEWSMELRRNVALQQFNQGRETVARYIYRTLYWNGDPIGTNNWAVLNFRHRYQRLDALPSRQQKRKTYRRIRAATLNGFRTAGRKGLSTGHYNYAAMTGSRRHYRLAAKAGDQVAREIVPKLSDTEDYAHTRTLADTGDVMAALRLGLKLHFKGNRVEELHYLRLAAEAGIPRAQTAYAWKHINTKDPNHDEARHFLLAAATAGDVRAANILGECHLNAYYFCSQPDFEAAAKWFQVATAPVIRPANPAPRITKSGAFRVWFPTGNLSKNINHAESAMVNLAKLYMAGKGVPLDRAKARALLSHPKLRTWKEAQTLLAQLRS